MDVADYLGQYCFAPQGVIVEAVALHSSPSCVAANATPGERSESLHDVAQVGRRAQLVEHMEVVRYQAVGIEAD